MDDLWGKMLDAIATEPNPVEKVAKVLLLATAIVLGVVISSAVVVALVAALIV